MNKTLKVLKGILLYFTIIYFCLFVMSVDSLSNNGALWFWGAFGILIVLLVSCYFTIENENLKDYFPF